MNMYTDLNRLRATDPGTVEGNPVHLPRRINPSYAEVDDSKNAIARDRSAMWK